MEHQPQQLGYHAAGLLPFRRRRAARSTIGGRRSRISAIRFSRAMMSSLLPGRRLKSVPWTAISRSEEHTSELQSLMRISYAVFCLKKKKQNENVTPTKSRHNNNVR